ncbi:pyroglutamylated RFamide peptide receptor-like [Mizuhopecten yessoensis]|uniref:Pyroglutamylated RFamide peptide receptor n=1 Tax=Mizuhopecten yessoensis TaxID=6573 RepID=A0A210QVM6_MIZYE|nr:pyroglutamylated RFamide peptide receptor-like [Mizuhopecten yessoensis]OWF52712.1 Pyroglutamylated RFamide peptide receptor [Mizuhopecten yessoensis]
MTAETLIPTVVDAGNFSVNTPGDIIYQEAPTVWDDSFYWNMNISFFDSSGKVNAELLNMLPDSFFNTIKDDFYGRREPMTIILMVLYSAAFISGLLGNIFVIAVVIQYQHMRTLTNVFLVSLTVGDLLVVLICIPMTLGSYVYSDYIFGTFMCKLTPFLQGTAVAVSSLSLLSISINRYFAIHSPLKAKVLFSKNKIYLLLFLVWLVSLCSFIPQLVVCTVVTSGLQGVYEMHVCLELWYSPVTKQIYSMFIFFVLFFIPLVAMLVTYTRIGYTLWRTEARRFMENSITNKSQAERILRQRRRTVKMLVAVVMIFVFCWFPYYAVMIWLDFNMVLSERTQFVNDYIYPIVLLLGLSNSTVNPVCYCFMSNGFRRAFLKLCCRQKLTSGKNVLLTVRFKSSDDSQIESVVTALS